MKRLNPIICTTLACSLCSWFPGNALFGGGYQSDLFRSIELIYDESFDVDGPHDMPEQWEIRQNTQWNVVDGVLVGRVATEDFQKKIQATGDGHDGTRAVILLKPVPRAFVIQMRVRYDDTPGVGRNRGSLLGLGHHVNSFVFGHDHTTLSLRKKKKFTLDRNFFPLNQWNDLAIEIKEGVIIIQVNDRKEIFKDELITLQNDVEMQQVDFKGQDFGTVRIDWLKLYRGIE